MVGRSKPQKKMEPKPSIDFSAAETMFLKSKNQELAKALADSKSTCAQLVQERDILQRELFAVNSRYLKLQNYVQNVDASARACINTIVASSNHVTEILQTTNNMIRLRKSIADDSRTSLGTPTFNGSAHSSPGLPNKTQAVKPMIGGHVIFRPTINLRRVNEIPIEEILRMQSDSQTQTSSQNGTESAPSENQDQDDSTTRNLYSRHVAGSSGSAFQNLQTGANEPVDNNEADDEYTDRTSDVSEIQSEADNRLDTVQEENESNLPSETHLNSLGNSNTSLTIPGSNSQVPLLSGVFRDVRVYLSPMQNLGQYLEHPLQHITTERGSSKSHKSKRPRSARSSENGLRNSVNASATENRKPSTSSAAVTPNNIMNATGDHSFNATLQTPLLSSTQIASPKSSPTTKSEDGSSYIRRLRHFDNKYDSSASNQTNFANSNGTPFNSTNSKWSTMKHRHTDNSFDSRSFRLNKAASANDDPLEGPSNMLDSFDTTIKNKIETLSGLGLTPTFLENFTSTPRSPSSPASAVLHRREQRRCEETTPKKLSKTVNVTKRKAVEKKKAAIVSTRIAKVIIRRISIPKNRLSDSPHRKSSTSTPKQSDSTVSTKGPSSGDSSRKTDTSLESASLVALRGSSSGSLSSDKAPPKKRGRKSKRDLTLLLATKKSDSPFSPRKRGRPRRNLPPTSCKEPSLRKKLRRSK